MINQVLVNCTVMSSLAVLVRESSCTLLSITVRGWMTQKLRDQVPACFYVLWKMMRKVALQPSFSFKERKRKERNSKSYYWHAILKHALSCFEGSVGVKSRRSCLPMRFYIWLTAKRGTSLNHESTDEGINLQQPKVVHHWVGCQKAEALPSTGTEHQLQLLILTVVSDAW